jgi:[FeFe] hydrogenase (group B1/B3)
MQIGQKSEAVNMYRDLMTRVIKGVYDGSLESTIDKLPEELFKEGSTPKYFDSIETERAVCRRQLASIVGQLVDPSKPLDIPVSACLKKTLARKPKEYVPGATIIEEGCKACGPSRIVITDACEGCVARPCIIACPKKAIERVDGKAKLDPAKCINCGMCEKLCPYKAIIRKKVPCIDDCPVDAIKKDSKNRSVIDPAKCIHCGRCSIRCPFGTITMPSEVVDVVSAIKSGKKVIAMFAPAVLGQFNGTVAQMNQACIASGFSEMVEVAIGADTTSLVECKEWLEHVSTDKQPVLLTSCCPAWVRATEQHLSGIKPYVSTTQSPMVYTGDLLKKRDPTCITVFVGPCTAKRTEALKPGKENTDLVITAEELSCIFAAKGVEVTKMPAADPKTTRLPSTESSNYCATQGVTAAVIQAVPKAKAAAEKEGHPVGDKQLKPVYVSPLDRTSWRQMKGWDAKPATIPGNLVEVMCCEGGCIGGPGNIIAPNVGMAKVKKILPERPKFDDIEDVLSL